MRKGLFDAIKAKLAAEVPEVKHVDLWNRNVEFIEQEDGWERPAVFVEIGPIEWEPLKPGVRRGRGTVKLHMVTDWACGGQTAGWDLSLDVADSVEGLRGPGFGPLRLSQTLTNHDHEEILETVDVYDVRYLG